MLGRFLAHADHDTREALLTEFNHAKPYFVTIGRLVIDQVKGVTTDRLSKEAIARLLTKIGSPLMSWWGHAPVLAELATEGFVARELLPRLACNDLSAKDRVGLLRVLDEAGRRHNRRYVVA
jgi:hypothetical protein